MASLSVTATAVNKIGGRVYVRWDDGTELEFRSLADAQAFADVLTDPPALRLWLKRAALSRYLQVDPAGTNPALIVGHTITATNDSNAMVGIT